ncbi:hypothetical protein GCM10010381_39390 [Streptomyces xantholiticus]|nr:hypothetical protein GCM10010381_39390 [Streptomyces xantholiticus]
MAAAPGRSLHRMELGPPPDACCLGEYVQDAIHRLAEVVRFENCQRKGLEQRAAVVGRISCIPLRVDSRPRLAAGPQNVPDVEVTVDEGVRLEATSWPESEIPCLFW